MMPNPNPMAVRNRHLGSAMMNPLYVPSGPPLSADKKPEAVLNAWMKNEDVDYVFVCHSQGCNIAMHVLNQGCSK